MSRCRYGRVWKFHQQMLSGQMSQRDAMIADAYDHDSRLGRVGFDHQTGAQTQAGLGQEPEELWLLIQHPRDPRLCRWATVRERL